MWTELTPDSLLTRLTDAEKTALESASTSLPDVLADIAGEVAAEWRGGIARHVALSIRPLAVPGELLEARVPNLILQPLVENALRHGLAARARPGRVEVRALRQGDDLQLWVRDDGRGLPPGASERVGLSNTRARLALMYPGRHRFDLRNAPDGGVVAEIVIPLRTRP